jgi:predicted transcriptional regulator of viral defense system
LPSKTSRTSRHKPAPAGYLPTGAPRIGPRRGRVSLLAFIGSHPVFRLDDLAQAFPHRARASLTSALQHQVNLGTLHNLHRGVYTRLPDAHLDPWLLGSRLTPAAVVAQEGALAFHHLCKPTTRIPLVSRTRLLEIELLGHRYVSLRYPWGRDEDRDGLFELLGLTHGDRQGLKLAVQCPERAFVDCADRLEHLGGLEWLAGVFLETRELHPNRLADFALKLGSHIAIARIGLLMEAHEQLQHARSAIARLEREHPASPTIFDPAYREGGRLVPRWNAIIPRWFHQLRGDLT